MIRFTIRHTFRILAWVFRTLGTVFGWVARKAERPACRCGCPGSAPVAPAAPAAPVIPPRPAHRPAVVPVRGHAAIRAAQNQAWQANRPGRVHHVGNTASRVVDVAWYSTPNDAMHAGYTLITHAA